MRPRAAKRSWLWRSSWTAAALVIGCAGTPWPNEPGVPVELAQSDNVDAEDAFWVTLTSRRRPTSLPALVPGERYQDELRRVARDLQAGRVSASQARAAAEEWGRAAYRCDVDSYVLDCSAGAAMSIPDALVRMPGAAIAYAAAHFRPRSLASNQCAIIVVVPNASTVEPAEP